MSHALPTARYCGPTKYGTNQWTHKRLSQQTTHVAQAANIAVKNYATRSGVIKITGTLKKTITARITLPSPKKVTSHETQKSHAHDLNK